MKETQDDLGNFGFSVDKTKSNFNRKFSQLSSLQNSRSYEKAQKIQKEAFLNLLDLLLSSVDMPQKPTKVGHPFTNLRDVIFCCAIKVYLGISSRRVISELRMLQELGYVQTIPSFAVINSYMRDKEIKNIIKELIMVSSLPLRKYENVVCIDSSGFSSKRYLSWQNARLKPSRMDKWVKAHLCIGDKSKIIISVEATESYKNDTLYFKPLLKQAVKNFKNIKQVSADKGYSSKKNFSFARSLNINAYIPFKSNIRLNKFGQSEWDKKFREFIENPDEFNVKYHRRSLVESVFWMVKAKHFQKVYSKDLNGAINEALFKCLIHNLYILTVYYYEKQELKK